MTGFMHQNDKFSYEQLYCHIHLLWAKFSASLTPRQHFYFGFTTTLNAKAHAFFKNGTIQASFYLTQVSDHKEGNPVPFGGTWFQAIISSS